MALRYGECNRLSGIDGGSIGPRASSEQTWGGLGRLSAPHRAWPAGMGDSVARCVELGWPPVARHGAPVRGSRDLGGPRELSDRATSTRTKLARLERGASIAWVGELVVRERAGLHACDSEPRRAVERGACAHRRLPGPAVWGLDPIATSPAQTRAGPPGGWPPPPRRTAFGQSRSAWNADSAGFAADRARVNGFRQRRRCSWVLPGLNPRAANVARETRGRKRRRLHHPVWVTFNGRDPVVPTVEPGPSPGARWHIIARRERAELPTREGPGGAARTRGWAQISDSQCDPGSVHATDAGRAHTRSYRSQQSLGGARPNPGNGPKW
jgi:hypothetical protein